MEALLCIALPFFLCISCIAYFTRVAADTEVAYKLVAELVQEPPAGEQQIEEAVEQAPEDVANPVDLQGKPRSITLTFNLCNVLFKVLHIYV